MTLLIVTLFVIGPILEIYVLLQAGAAFGALPVAAACLATAVIGGILLRMQGLGALATAQRELNEGKAPVASITDGVFLLIAAPFLMTPGFITDVAGFALLTPPIRRFLAARAVEYFKARADLRTNTITIHRS